jgi:hypothetical protein
MPGLLGMHIHSWTLALALGLSVMAAAWRPDARAAETQVRSLVVDPDLATVLKLPAETAAVVVGNPAVADVVITSGGSAVITGKGAGTTNLIIQDGGGEVLLTVSVQVKASPEEAVSVYRGTVLETVLCRPRCQPPVAAPASPVATRPASPLAAQPRPASPP